MSFRPIKSSENTQYEFDDKIMKTLYDQLAKGKAKGSKSRILEDISVEAGVSLETVRGWVYGKSSPSELSMVKGIAKVLGCEYTLLLHETKKEKETMKDVNNKITKREMKVARKIYIEILRLIDTITWSPMEEIYISQYEFDEIMNSKKSEESSCHQHKNPASHEDPSKAIDRFRYKILFKIRKAAFDLSFGMRNSLESLVNDCFGPYHLEYGWPGILESTEYREYLRINDFGDCDDSRIKYCTMFREKAYARLDQIFERYIKH